MRIISIRKYANTWSISCSRHIIPFSINPNAQTQSKIRNTNSSQQFGKCIQYALALSVRSPIYQLKNRNLNSHENGPYASFVRCHTEKIIAPGVKHTNQLAGVMVRKLAFKRMGSCVITANNVQIPGQTYKPNGWIQTLPRFDYKKSKHCHVLAIISLPSGQGSPLDPYHEITWLLKIERHFLPEKVVLGQKFLSRKNLSRKYRSIFASKIRPATGVKYQGTRCRFPFLSQLKQCKNAPKKTLT